jgi:hypothetical protein
MADVIEANTHARATIKMATVTSRLKLGSTADRMEEYKNGEMTSRLYRRTQLLCAVGAGPWMARSARWRRGAKKKVAEKDTDIPPLDGARSRTSFRNLLTRNSYPLCTTKSVPIPGREHLVRLLFHFKCDSIAILSGTN